VHGTVYSVRRAHGVEPFIQFPAGRYQCFRWIDSLNHPRVTPSGFGLDRLAADSRLLPCLYLKLSILAKSNRHCLVQPPDRRHQGAQSIQHGMILIVSALKRPLSCMKHLVNLSVPTREAILLSTGYSVRKASAGEVRAIFKAG
jgi:hypothetical protein